MNLVVPQQFKDRFSEAQASVRGQLVALQQLVPADLTQLFSGLREKVQLLLDIAPRTELLALQTKLEELSSELSLVATERDSLKDELVKLLDNKLAALPAPALEAPALPAESTIEVVLAAPLEVEAPAPVVAPKTATRPTNNKKNGPRRR